MKYLFFAILVSASFSAHAAPKGSAYTSLNKGCTTLKDSANDPNAEIDYFTSVCPGRDGLEVGLNGMDSRSWIVLRKIGTPNDDNDMGGQSFSEKEGQFPNVAGAKLEWRYNDGKLVALIVRIQGQESDSQKERITLAVLRVDAQTPKKTCVVGVVNAKLSHANEKARELADNASLKCPTR